MTAGTDMKPFVAMVVLSLATASVWARGLLDAVAAGISSSRISFVVLLALFATARAHATAAGDAMTWAVEHQQEAFEQVMPAAARYGPNKPETTLTVRSEGFEDRFDFLLQITHRENAAPTATVVLPEGAPLVVQLARARLLGAPTLEVALKTIRLKNIALPPTVAKRLFYALMKTCVPLRPQTGVFIHREIYELSVVGWSDFRLIISDDRDRTRSPFGDVFREVKEAIEKVDVTAQTLKFDAQLYYKNQ